MRGKSTGTEKNARIVRHTHVDCGMECSARGMRSSRTRSTCTYRVEKDVQDPLLDPTKTDVVRDDER